MISVLLIHFTSNTPSTPYPYLYGLDSLVLGRAPVEHPHLVQVRYVGQVDWVLVCYNHLGREKILITRDLLSFMGYWSLPCHLPVHLWVLSEQEHPLLRIKAW